MVRSKRDGIISLTGLFWYNLNFTLPAAANAYIDDGSMTSMVPNQCIAHFFLGSKENAAETYTRF